MIRGTLSNFFGGKIRRSFQIFLDGWRAAILDWLRTSVLFCRIGWFCGFWLWGIVNLCDVKCQTQTTQSNNPFSDTHTAHPIKTFSTTRVLPDLHLTPMTSSNGIADPGRRYARSGAPWLMPGLLITLGLPNICIFIPASVSFEERLVSRLVV